ncbi:MAG: histidine triad nucleotide-binding protein [Dethiobacteria bacterium]
MSDCLFCRIVNKEAEADIVYEDDEIVAFKDIYPAAPIHLLIIPRKHIDSLIDMKEEDVTLIGKMHLVANKLARNFQIDKKGFRTVINCGRDAGQAVYHIHLHLLGGQSLSNSFAAGRGV